MKASECPIPQKSEPFSVTPKGEWLVLDSCPVWRGEKWLDSFLVRYPCSVEYNGGTLYKGKWYRGYKVPVPVAPEGYSFKGIGIAQQLNCHPPYATVLLVPEKEKD